MPNRLKVLAFAVFFSTAAFGQTATRQQRVAPNPTVRITKTQKPAASTAKFSDEILAAQIALASAGISCGSLDGLAGGQTSIALKVYQKREKLPVTGKLDGATKIRLKLPAAAPLKNYIFSQEDSKRLNPIPKTWLEKSEAESLDFETALELIAEKHFAHPKLIRQLNAKINWSKPLAAGTIVRVPDVKQFTATEKAATIKISLQAKTLAVFGANNKLLAHFPCSIAAKVEKRPTGKLEVVNFAANPNYTFDPVNFPESEEAKSLNRKLILPPGANNPVGLAWIGLSLPGYGIHGTPAPEQVGRTESHGCFRMTNWDVQRLAKLVKVGTGVVVEN